MNIEAKHKLQITKFSLYGFLKNLKIFEPFLYYYLLTLEFSLLEIGLLISIREGIIYVFEVPSGVLADKYGKKNQLIMCFVFYIFSFVLFFIGRNYVDFVIAFIFFGLGESFRSGTHKAMIMQFLDKENITESKSKIYGKTRSYSLLGSMFSSLLAIFFVFIMPDIRYLFLIAIVPYLVDILLILSYPSYMNQRVDSSFRIKEFVVYLFASMIYVFKERKVRDLIISSSTYQGWFKVVKDYIQYIIVLSATVLVVLGDFTSEETERIYLGVIYAIVFFFSAIASRNTHKIKQFFTRTMILDFMWIPLGVSILFTGIFLNNIYIVLGLFILLYISLNIRKPLMIEKIGDEVVSTERASTLSIDSQLTSLFVIIFAPVLGYLSDLLGIHYALAYSGMFIILYALLKMIVKFLKRQMVKELN